MAEENDHILETSFSLISPGEGKTVLMRVILNFEVAFEVVEEVDYT